MTDPHTASAQPEIDLPQLERSLRHPRLVFSYFMSLITGTATILAMFPLFSVLFMLIRRGGADLSFATLAQLPPAAMMPGGGIGNAIVGTLVIVFTATILSVPVGIMTAVYVAEFEPDGNVAKSVRFAAKILTGLPSILAGVFAFAAVVMVTGKFSAPAGGVALALLMLPTIILTAEDALKRVPRRMREAAIGMGTTPTQLVRSVLLPTAMPGILTGIMLAISRAAGETAPLLFTSLFSEYWISHSWPVFIPKSMPDLMKPTASLAVLIYNFSGSPFDNQIQLAWTAALVLVAMVLVANLVGQNLAKRYNC
jgi:phosphate transport system permease protein